ncbi:MAG: HD domain-containing protein [Methanomicrobia archaeon]|jgi:3'-5' exoribonuclease|nr:HD domain-containing protein [Methanomicrobia archaeon]HNY74899.1 HD domain-containing protein [Bacilli bacterium]HOC80850.1 HD domain-containing protein [Bacilli bacterium]HOH67825.1 HD domain-containing protein [Bacilli bacterium]HQC32304.1 HD domain-containing protein [Bacilli bacterium]
MKWIKDFLEGDLIRGPLLVVNANKGVTNNGLAYMNVTLQDKTGTIEAKKWDINEVDAALLNIGNVVLVDGDVLNYRDNLQVKIRAISKVNDDEFDATRFTMASPIPLEELEKRLDSYVNSLKDKDIALLTKTLIGKYYKSYITYPAAVRNHHEFASGLLHHTVSMADLGEAIANLYPSVDRDMLIAGILLHDLGKTLELSGPIIPKYTLEGKLIGHISITHAEIQKSIEALKINSETATLLSHMVLSHHGKYEYGSPVLPLTREAYLLSVIDDLDAKMMILDKAYDQTPEGEFSTRIYAMDDRSFYKPKKR